MLTITIAQFACVSLTKIHKSQLWNVILSIISIVNVSRIGSKKEKTHALIVGNPFKTLKLYGLWWKVASGNFLSLKNHQAKSLLQAGKSHQIRTREDQFQKKTKMKFLKLIAGKTRNPYKRRRVKKSDDESVSSVRNNNYSKSINK
jgi:hypothetical protein